MKPRATAPASSHDPHGFSLVELLVVVALIAVLSSLAILGFGSSRSAGGRSAADLAASLALSARVEAMSQGYGSLLAIDNSSNPEHKFQRLAVFRFTNSSSPPELAGRVVPLPRGTFFLPKYSSATALITTNLNLPPGNTSTALLALRFDGSGQLVEPVSADLVFGPDIMDSSGNLQDPETLAAARQGFKLRRNGRPVFFKTPDDMPPK